MITIKQDPVFKYHFNNKIMYEALMIALSASGGLIITIGLHLDSASKDRNIQFNKLLENFSQEIANIRLREINLKTIDEAIRYQRDWLHTVNRLAYLRKLKKIDDNMINYFEGSFIQAHLLLDWEDKILYTKSELDKKRWQYVTWWVSEKNIPSLPIGSLPPTLFEMYKKIDDGYILAHSNGNLELIKSSKQPKDDN